MPPQVILIRHGEAEHNWTLHDPNLTEKGAAQCKQLAIDLQTRYTFPQETLIVVSPLVRTLQSFQHGLAWLAEKGVPVELRAEWQETTGNPCDIGTEIDKIAPEWPHLDFSTVDKAWPAKTGLYDPSQEGLLNRARVVREWLYHRPEKYVVVMTHSGFIRRVAPSNSKYANAEFRIYNFAVEDESDDRAFHLLEIEGVHQSLSTKAADSEDMAA
ncbi:hypothetical protein TruAng_008681 [Truncatella angustata]|nr:hypothetical protein TruAng_008681 [Truncatella angustata]